MESKARPRDIIARLLGPHVAAAVVASGLPVAATARLLVERAEGESMIKSLGLIDAPALPPKTSAQVLRLLELSKARACDLVRGASDRPNLVPVRKATATKDTPGERSRLELATVTPAQPARRAPNRKLPRPQAEVEVAFTRSELIRPHDRCGEPMFEGKLFVGCLCFAELAKSSRTRVDGDNVVVTLRDPEGAARLLRERRKK